MVRKPITTKWNPLIDLRPISDLPATKFSRNLTRKYITKGTKCILDIGCGTGGFIYAFDEHYHCFGLDLDPNAVKVAKKYCLNSDFVVASASNLPFRDETFDITASWGVIEELGNETDMKLIGETYRILRPGGQLLLSASSDHIIYKLMNPAFFVNRIRHYNAKRLTKSIQERSFSIEECSIRGRWYSLISISIFYFYKHILHKIEGNGLRRIYKKMDKEFESNKKGMYIIFMAAKKISVKN